MDTSKNGAGLWAKMINRNKRMLTLDLRQARGAGNPVRPGAGADVLIENFRPGTLEKWGIGPEKLLAINPRLVLLRMTAFGQSRPVCLATRLRDDCRKPVADSRRSPGRPDGPPTLPPFGLADGIAGLAGAIATHVRAVRARCAWRNRPGHRRGDHRAHPDDPRRAGNGVRPARASSSSEAATGRPTTPRATRTARATRSGWPSRPAASPSPSA